MHKKLFTMISVILIATFVLSACASKANTPLVVAYGQFSQKFSPFFADSAYDTDAETLT